MPILSSAVFDNTGKAYDVSKILTPDFLFDREAYQNYSRTYLPVTYLLSYGVQFAGLSALVTHTICWHGKEIWEQTVKSFREDRNHKKSKVSGNRRSRTSDIRDDHGRSSSSAEPKFEGSMKGEDVHNRLMNQYPDAPMVWYLITLVAMLAVGMFVVEYYPVHLPWYGLVMALGITAVLFIPVGIVMAITNQQSSLYIICQLICGVVFPGRPVANMVFVTYGYISSTQGMKFSSDLKLGHYMKIPPRLLFQVQMVATLVASLTQIGVLNWMFSYIPGICTPEAINGFSCPIARVHFNGSILWGVIGPKRFFGPGALYRPLVWAFLIGAIGPIMVWLVGRHRAAGSIWRKINLPVVFGSLSFIPPAVRPPLPSESEYSPHPIFANLHPLPPPSDRPELLRLGRGLLHLQLRPPPPRAGLVGQIHHDPVRSAGLRPRLWRRRHLLRLHLPRLGLRADVVGNRGLQAGILSLWFSRRHGNPADGVGLRLEGVSVSIACSGCTVWALRLCS